MDELLLLDAGQAAADASAASAASAPHPRRSPSDLLFSPSISGAGSSSSPASSSAMSPAPSDLPPSYLEVTTSKSVAAASAQAASAQAAAAPRSRGVAALTSREMAGYEGRSLGVQSSKRIELFGGFGWGGYFLLGSSDK